MKMKRLFALLLVLSMAFLVVGCASGNDKTTEAPTEATEAGPDYENMLSLIHI